MQSNLCLQETPFYRFLPADCEAFEMFSQGLLKENGRLTKKIRQIVAGGFSKLDINLISEIKRIIKCNSQLKRYADLTNEFSAVLEGMSLSINRLGKLPALAAPIDNREETFLIKQLNALLAKILKVWKSKPYFLQAPVNANPSLTSHDPSVIRKKICEVNHIEFFSSLVREIIANKCKKKEAKLLQGLVGWHISNMTFSKKSEVNSIDFPEMILNFSLGVRCYQKGWIEKILKVYILEVQNQGTSLPIILAKDLRSLSIGRPLEVLIGMTFNASCLLLNEKETHADDIDKLWRLIFNQFQNRSELPLAGFFKTIEEMMRNEKVTFKELYSQLQISFAINLYAGGGQKFNLTQTAGKLYCQIDLNFCTLFFPFALTSSVKEMKKIGTCTPFSLTPLQILHDKVVSETYLSSRFENAPLKIDCSDFRSEIKESSEAALTLLDATSEHAWRMGFLLSLSLLCQTNNPVFLQDFVRQHLRMLKGSWATEDFKFKATVLLRKLLSGRGINFSDSLFITVEAPVLIQDLFGSNIEPLVELGWEELVKFETFGEQEDFIDLYKKIMKKNFFQNPARNVSTSHEMDCKDYLHEKNVIAYIPLSNRIQLDVALSWLIGLYTSKKIRNIPLLEMTLFETLLNIMQSLHSLPTNLPLTTLKSFQKLSLKLLKKNASRTLTLTKKLRFAREVMRLKIIPAHEEQQQASFRSLLEFIVYNFADNYGLNFNTSLEELETFLIFKPDSSSGIELFLRTSIDIRLQRLQDRIFTFGDVITLFFLFDDYIQIPNAWEQRQYLFKALKSVVEIVNCEEGFCNVDNVDDGFENPDSLELSFSNEELKEYVNAFLDKFHAVFGDKEMLSSFYMGEMENEYLRIKLLKLTTTLLSRDLDPATDEIYRQCTAVLVDFYCPNYLLSTKQKLPFEAFVQQLYKRKLWLEILKISTNVPFIHSEYSETIVNVLIEACYQTTTNFMVEGSDRQDQKVFELSERIPITLLAKNALKEKVKEILKVVYVSCLKSKLYFNAQICLERYKTVSDSLDLSFLQTAVALAGTFRRYGEHQISKSILVTLPNNGLNKFWTVMYRNLIRNGQVSLCLDLLNNHKVIKASIPKALSKKWMLIFHEMINKINVFNSHKELIREEQLIELRQTANSILLRCEPRDAASWIDYIKWVGSFGLIDEVEQVLQFLASSKFEGILSQQEKLKCWRDIFDRMIELSSQKFLHINLWWPFIWKDFASETVERRNELYYKLTAGMINVINTFSISEKPGRTNSHLIKGLKAAATIILTEDLSNLDISDKNILLQLGVSKILWSTNDVDLRHEALRLLYTCFMVLDCTDIVIDKKHLEIDALYLFFDFLLNREAFNEEDILANALVLIPIAQRCTYNGNNEHFRILEFLLDIFPLVGNGLKQNGLLKQTMSHIEVYLGMINTSLAAILSNSENSVPQILDEREKIFRFAKNFALSSQHIVNRFKEKILKEWAPDYAKSLTVAEAHSSLSTIQNSFFLDRSVKTLDGMISSRQVIRDGLFRYHYFDKKNLNNQFCLHKVEKNHISFYSQIVIIILVLGIAYTITEIHSKLLRQV